jgi:hypothetical protein
VTAAAAASSSPAAPAASSGRRARLRAACSPFSTVDVDEHVAGVVRMLEAAPS